MWLASCVTKLSKPMRYPTLEDQRVALIPLADVHFEALVPIALAHPDLLRYSPSPFGTAEKLKAYFATALEGQKTGTRQPYAIYAKDAKAYVGSTSFGCISTVNQRIEIGWTWLDPAHQGTGINTHCKLLLLTHAFEELGMQRVEFRTDTRNLQSRAAIRKLGATEEGIFRSHTVMLDGHRRDTVFFGILAAEWPEIKKQLSAKIITS